MRVRLQALAVPVLAASLLLYQALATLQTSILRPETALAAAGFLAGGLAVGMLAFLGGRVIRAVVLAGVVVLLFDVALGLSGVFDALTPAVRARESRDRQRVHDIGVIHAALETYIATRGALPSPAAYGEGIGPAEFWEGWWDVSSADTNGDGRYFLDFLEESGVLSNVPVDPINRGDDSAHPARGQHYVFYVAPPEYAYAGGSCAAGEGKSTYLLAIVDLEGETSRPPLGVDGSGCTCLWNEQPDFFQQYFDYVVCGQFAP